jgi:NTP pyrophosphatase (non-canonical NTP hydrolase)
MLPDLDAADEDASAGLSSRRRLADFQRFHKVLDREKGFIADLFFNYICLTEEIGEIGRVIKQTWRRQEDLLPQTGNRQEAMDRALDQAKVELQEELADALAFLLKIANDSGIDLEAAYLSKMDRNLSRSWPNK